MSGDFFFFFNDTATTEIYTLPLHDALPICSPARRRSHGGSGRPSRRCSAGRRTGSRPPRSQTRRSEEHTSELQSRQYLVCRLLLEKKKNCPITSTLSSSKLAAYTHYLFTFQ